LTFWNVLVSVLGSSSYSVSGGRPFLLGPGRSYAAWVEVEVVRRVCHGTYAKEKTQRVIVRFLIGKEEERFRHACLLARTELEKRKKKEEEQSRSKRLLLHQATCHTLVPFPSATTITPANQTNPSKSNAPSVRNPENTRPIDRSTPWYTDPGWRSRARTRRNCGYRPGRAGGG